MSYVSNRHLTNVKGRIDYISNPKRQENIIDFYNSKDINFWNQLAIENQEQFKITSHAKKNEKPVEAREFIIALPQNIDTTNLCKTLCDDFKNRYGVECACAIHYKAKENNLHAHLIYAERELLPEPITVEQRVAPRTYYYDAKGKKCKKADAIKVVPKGTILEKGRTKYFANKKDFFNMGFVKDYKKHFENDFNLPSFDKTRHFATKHIGKNNPKAEYIAEYNTLVTEINKYFDMTEKEYNLKGQTPKQVFCDIIGSSTVYVPQNDEIKEVFGKFKELYPLYEKTAQNRFESLSDGNFDVLSAIEQYNQALNTEKIIKRDITRVFNSWDCPYQMLSRNASWEQNVTLQSHLRYSDVDYASNKVNELIKKYNFEIDPIPSKPKAVQAKSVADIVYEALKVLLENIKEFVLDLAENLFENGIDTNKLNDFRENDYHSIEDEFEDMDF